MQGQFLLRPATFLSKLLNLHRDASFLCDPFPIRQIVARDHVTDPSRPDKHRKSATYKEIREATTKKPRP
ncbi:MAG: hypothetical protein DHS20C03_14520 [Minwuia thermotolerans]|nr:MAG: hypothetical protein DHS20C03_14520 [Minwuia thermotolerans]